VADMSVTCLSNNGLDVKNVSAYSADNASVNYGCKKSVFTALKALNGGILKANCNAHIVHNTLRKMTDVLDCDVETIVRAVYSHFSISANRRVELKEFFEFVDVEYHDLLRHVTTRWLSLGPAIKRLLQSWPALISYFRSLGQDCPKRIAKSLGLSNTDANDDDDGDIKLNVSKACLLFVHNLCTLFENTVLALECESVTVCEVYPIMQKLRAKSSDRLADSFFGYEATAILESQDIPCDVKQTVERNFCAALERALSYLEQWFDFSENNIACALQALSLKNMPTFQQIKTVAEVLKLTSVLNMHELYDEYSTHKVGLQHVVRGNDGVALAVALKGTRFFQSCESEVPPNLFQLIAFVLSVPGSNAFPERIFSLMNSKWTCK